MCDARTPRILPNAEIFKTNMAAEPEVSFLSSDIPDDVLWGKNDLEEDENEAADDISELLKSLNWISSKKGYENYRKVLERITIRTGYSHDTALKVEQTIAQELLDSSEKNMELVFDFLKAISNGFFDVYKNVEHINCPKNKVIQLEKTLHL